MKIPRVTALCLAFAACLPPAFAEDTPTLAAAQSEMQKWIATTDEGWQAAFKRGVTDAHEAEVNKLKLQYLNLLDEAVAKASKASDLDGAVALRNEQKRFSDTEFFPETDEAGDAALVKQARTALRALLAQAEKGRAARAKALLAKYDLLLADAQTQLTKVQRLEDALLVKAKREEVAAAWGTPAVANPSQTTPPANIVQKTPAVTKPATGTVTPGNGAFGKTAAKPGALDDALAQRIKAVIDAHSFERLEPMAGRGLAHGDLPKEGAILVGFEYITGTWKGDKMVKSLKPLFLTPGGVVSGIGRGKPDKAYKTLKAREGFAVSGLIVNPGKERLGGFQMIYVKIPSRPTPFEKPETYKSEWIGGELRKDAVTLGGDGKLGIGVLVCAGADVDGIGLIVAP